jgi:tRNA(fMet)-specific endonuclease VapC
MIVLDTDHLGEFEKGTSSAAKQLKDRLHARDETVATTIISLEEMMRGWLAAIHRQRDSGKQILSYQRLARLLNVFSAWIVLPWDEGAVRHFESLRTAKLRVGTMDLKIASIALSCDATLLSGNLRDFEHIPGLRVEDWLHAS